MINVSRFESGWVASHASEMSSSESLSSEVRHGFSPSQSPSFHFLLLHSNLCQENCTEPTLTDLNWHVRGVCCTQRALKRWLNRFMYFATFEPLFVNVCFCTTTVHPGSHREHQRHNSTPPKFHFPSMTWSSVDHLWSFKAFLKGTCSYFPWRVESSRFSSSCVGLCPSHSTGFSVKFHVHAAYPRTHSSSFHFATLSITVIKFVHFTLPRNLSKTPMDFDFTCVKHQRRLHV